MKDLSWEIERSLCVVTGTKQHFKRPISLLLTRDPGAPPARPLTVTATTSAVRLWREEAQHYVLFPHELTAFGVQRPSEPSGIEAARRHHQASAAEQSTPAR